MRAQQKHSRAGSRGHPVALRELDVGAAGGRVGHEGARLPLEALLRAAADAGQALELLEQAAAAAGEGAHLRDESRDRGRLEPYATTSGDHRDLDPRRGRRCARPAPGALDRPRSTSPQPATRRHRLRLRELSRHRRRRRRADAAGRPRRRLDAARRRGHLPRGGGTRPAGGTFSAPRELGLAALDADPTDTLNQRPSPVEVEVDDAGSAGDRLARAGRRQARRAGVDRPAAPHVNVSSPGQDASDVKLAMQRAGEAVAVWTRSNGTDDIVAGGDPRPPAARSARRRTCRRRARTRTTPTSRSTRAATPSPSGRTTPPARPVIQAATPRARRELTRPPQR